MKPRLRMEEGGNLTWELLLASVEQLSGHRSSRFTFADYPDIALAFSTRKDDLRGALPRTQSEPKDEKLRKASKRSDRLIAKKTHLEAENFACQQRFTAPRPSVQRWNPEFEHTVGCGFHLDDVLLCTRNLWDKGIQNGSLGRIVELAPSPSAAGSDEWLPRSRTANLRTTMYTTYHGVTTVQRFNSVDIARWLGRPAAIY